MIPKDQAFLQKVRAFMAQIQPYYYEFAAEIETWHLGPGVFAFMARYMESGGILLNPGIDEAGNIMLDIFSGRTDITRECFKPDIPIERHRLDVGFLPFLLERGSKDSWWKKDPQWSFANGQQAMEVVRGIIVPQFALFDKPHFINPSLPRVVYFGPNYQ